MTYWEAFFIALGAAIIAIAVALILSGRAEKKDDDPGSEEVRARSYAALVKVFKDLNRRQFVEKSLERSYEANR